jgi:hypothetical protein
MDGQRLGSVIGVVFGLIYVVVDAQPLPLDVGVPLEVLGGLAFVAVLIAVARSGDRDHRTRSHGFPP